MDFAKLMKEIEIIEQHMHPSFNVTVPNGAYRYAALTFNTAADAETVTITTGGTNYVYTFKTALGSPAASNVHVKVQGSVAATAAKLAQAVRGETDATNIAYGTGTQPNPGITAHYTGMRTSIGTVIHPAAGTIVGPTIRFREKNTDRDEATYPIALTDTTTHAGIYLLTDFIRTYQTRYTMTGNAAALGNRVAGAMQCIVPPYTVVDINGNYVKYDPSVLIVEGTNTASMIVECDLYYSLDEVTFTQMSMATELSRDTATAGSQEYDIRVPRVPASYGLYCKMRSNETATTQWQDIKVQLHTYEYGI